MRIIKRNGEERGFDLARIIGAAAKASAMVLECFRLLRD